MNLVPDWTIVPMWFVFISTVLVLNAFVFKPTLKILAERRKRTEGSDKEVKHLSEQTQIKLKEYEVVMAEALAVARGARDVILKQADLQQKEIVNEARAQAEKSLSVAKVQIQKDAETAREQLKAVATELAQSIKNKVVERKVA